MACAAGPDISENGLVLALDAGNSKGYDNDENLLTYSEQFNDASWAKNNYNVTANATTAPDGTLTADKLIAINASTFHDLYKSPGLGSNTYTLSIFAKAAEQSFIRLRIDDGAISRLAMFNLATGSVSSSVNVTSSTITPYPDGWYRCSITVTSAIVNAVFGSFPTSSGSTYSGDGVSGIFIWGAQFEYGSSASPYYATTASAKNRGSTLIDMTGRGNTGTLTNGPTFDSSNLGSIVFDGVNDYFNMTSNFNIAGVTNYSSSFWVNLNSSTTGVDVRFFWHGNYGVLVYKTTANNLSFYLRTTVTSIQTATPFSSFIGVWTNIAVTYDGSTMRLYVNGDLKNSASHSGGIINDNPTRFWLGGASTQYFTSCKISGVLEYNRALTAQEIQQNFNATRSRYSI